MLKLLYNFSCCPCQLTRLLCISISVDAEQAQAAREMAAELIRIADLLEQRVLFQAAETLTKKLDTCDTQVRQMILSSLFILINLHQ